ncbi:MAG TPA: hypothetical protein VGI47_04915 [Candidatus Binataceae bacterium]
MNQIKSTVAGMRTGATIAFLAIVCGVFAASSGWSAPTGSIAGRSRLQDLTLQLAAEPATAPAPPSETDEEDDKDVPTSQVDKYISVYESMQKDHNLTVEQATSKQGLTVAQFREIEGKIERDDTLRERVRKALRHERDKDSEN